MGEDFGSSDLSMDALFSGKMISKLLKVVKNVVNAMRKFCILDLITPSSVRFANFLGIDLSKFEKYFGS